MVGSGAVAAGEDDVVRVVLAEAEDCCFAYAGCACPCWYWLSLAKRSDTSISSDKDYLPGEVRDVCVGMKLHALGIDHKT